MKRFTEWEFDSHGHPPCKLTFQDIEAGNSKITLHIGDREVLAIEAARDQWGTYIDVSAARFTIAQEDGTRSFFEALLTAMSRLRGWADFGCIAPTVTEREVEEEGEP